MNVDMCMHMHMHMYMCMHMHMCMCMCMCDMCMCMHMCMCMNMLCVVVRGGSARLAALKQLLCRGRLDEAHHLFAPQRLARLWKAGRRARGA